MIIWVHSWTIEMECYWFQQASVTPLLRQLTTVAQALMHSTSDSDEGIDDRVTTRYDAYDESRLTMPKRRDREIEETGERRNTPCYFFTESQQVMTESWRLWRVVTLMTESRRQIQGNEKKGSRNRGGMRRREEGELCVTSLFCVPSLFLDPFSIPLTPSKCAVIPFSNLQQRRRRNASELDQPSWSGMR